MINGILLTGSLLCSTDFTRVKAAAPVAAPCTLMWKPYVGCGVSGYVVFYGIRGSAATNRVDVGLTNRVTFKNLIATSNYFFYAVTYSACGIESPPSATVYFTPPAVSTLKTVPSTNGSMIISFLAGGNTVCRIEYSSALNPPQWQTLTTTSADANGIVTVTDPLTGKPPQRFYRVVIP